MRRFAVSLVLAFLVVFASSSSALATDYKGDVDYWGGFTVSINNNQVTALSGRTGRIPCADGEDIAPVNFSLAASVPVTEGQFHADGTTLDDDHHLVFAWALDATVSVTRTISGTVTVTGPAPLMPAICARTFRVAAIIPPRQVYRPLHTTFVDDSRPTRGTAPAVYFDFRKGVVRHLSANAGTSCPGGSELGARLYTTAYRLDPVQVNDGRFRIVVDVLNDYGVITHVVLVGRIKGRTATGTLDSSTGFDLNGTLLPCTRHLRWRARSSRPSGASRWGGAFYAISPYRICQAGACTYYFAVETWMCLQRVTAVRVWVVGGPARTVACNTERRLGPLKPKRMYHVHGIALHTRHGRVFRRTWLGTAFMYVPGDDAYWVPVPWIP